MMSRYGIAGLTMTMSAPSSMSSADLADRLLGIGRVHLVAAPVAELRRRVGGLAERTVEARAVLGGVGHDRDLLEAVLVERTADGADAAVHHVRRRHDVGAGLGVRQRGPHQLLDGGVVEDLLAVQDAAVAVRRCTRTGTRR